MKTIAMVTVLMGLITSTAFAKDFICVSQKSQKLFSVKFNADKSQVLALESEDQGFSPGVVVAQVNETGVYVKMNRGRSGSAVVSAALKSKKDVVFEGVANIKGLDTHQINTKGNEKVRCMWDSIPF